MKRVHTGLTILLISSAPLLAPAMAYAQGHRGTAPTCDVIIPDDLPEGTYVTNTWPDGIVPYEFHANVTPGNQLKALDAMAEIESVAGVQFIPHTDEPQWIRIRDWSGNSSCVGVPISVCNVNILSWDLQYIIIHELMHSLGIWHEQQRPDRDEYVEINFDNIQPGHAGNFTYAGQAYGPYDFESIMHYYRNSWGIDFNWTIKVLEPYKRIWQRRLGAGYRDQMSSGDIWVLNFLYPGGALPPRHFELSSPPNGTLVGESWTPTFSWTASEMADSYRVLVDDNGAFLSPEIDATTTDTTYTHDGMLAAHKIHYWTVTSTSANGMGEPFPFRTRAFFTGSSVGPVLYVDDEAPASGAGSGWLDAMSDLQDALLLAETTGGAVTQIRVAQGTYRPDRGSLDPSMSFYLVEGVAVLGGYAGINEPDPDARDPDLYTTVLSGDLAGDDGPDFANNGENSNVVVYAVGVDETAVLDGFRISGGNGYEIWPDNSGGGFAADEASPLIRNCVFTGNEAYFGGAAEVRLESGATFDGCLFIGNRTWGFNGNPGDPDLGGALDLYFSDGATIVNSVFTDNLSAHGGAVDHWGGTATYVNTLFHDNTALVEGAAIRNYVGATATIANCTFNDNLAASGGGAVSGDGSDLMTVANSVLWGDAPDEIASAATVTYSDVQGGFAGAGNIDADPMFANAANGDYHLLAGSPCIDAADNTAVPPDAADIDDDGHTLEATPLDLDGNERFHDDPATLDTGVPGNGYDLDVVDMGPYEFGSSPPDPCPWDCANDDGEIGIEEFLAVLGTWGDVGAPCDFDADGVGIEDFLKIIGLWGPCP